MPDPRHEGPLAQRRAEALSFDEAELDEAAAINRRLALLPRLRFRNRLFVALTQGMLRLRQIGRGGALRRADVSVEEQFVGDGEAAVKVRILRPKGPIAGVVLDIHGGGWAIGNARMNDRLNLAMIQACDVAVVSVDYRLVGRTALEATMDDCLATTRWLLGGGLPEYAHLPALVVGESAGAHLAAATLLRLQTWPDLLARVSGALLYYGVYDLAGTDSVRNAGRDTLVLDGPNMVRELRRLTPDLDDGERRQAPLSPLHADLSGFPPTLLFVGDRDPLIDDSVGLADRLRAVTDVELEVVPKAPHGFIHLQTGSTGRVLEHSHRWIRRRLEASRDHDLEKPRGPLG